MKVERDANQVNSVLLLQLNPKRIHFLFEIELLLKERKAMVL